ncbi:LysR substrate-binding domain-containing protein [Peterkaempfera bronchialis]|uniref:LysR family transcriptional regulator n=1 Tax=Peterkaempfera bronchialis TaxID=2126346 RepID=A0A345SRL6_9ACTN|nr:LysR substrate-binding domain-containing protein [Peterkaempfera bronchialis]AXI76371.1 LysR family transcriptional regulator [Peterkaempfera bronchialis]
MFDPVQLQSFLTVAQTLSFTEAGRRLGLRQSTVSQHVRRLEQAAGVVLFTRDTHAVALTEDGEAMVGFARTILEAGERAVRHFAGTEVRGRLRFGVSEDFVLTRLPELLNAFRRSHPQVDLELTVELSAVLHRMLSAGRLDLVLAKRREGEEHGRLIRGDRLVWIGARTLRLGPGDPVPLLLYAPPSITRDRALESLERHGRPWRIACTSTSLSGLRAAALAGLGVLAHSRTLTPEGLVEVAPQARLPELGGVDFVLASRGPTEPGSPAQALADAVLADGDGLRRLT